MVKAPTPSGQPAAAPKTRPATTPRPTATKAPATQVPGARIKLVAAGPSGNARKAVTAAARVATEQGQDQFARRVDLPRRTIPEDVRQALSGKTFKNWSSMRRAVNKAWAKSPTVKGDPFFTPAQLKRMKSGLNPRSPSEGNVGRRGSMEYDHRKEIRDGGPAFDTRNLSLRTPLSHTKKLLRKFEIAATGRKPGGKPRI